MYYYIYFRYMSISTTFPKASISKICVLRLTVSKTFDFGNTINKQCACENLI